jgi:glycosyltransferase involved in cell wall biosynthesis
MTIHIIQPALPSYRIDFFRRVASAKGQEWNVVVYYSKIDMGALTKLSQEYAWSSELGPIISIFFGLFWQHGVTNISIQRGDIVVISGAPRCLSNIYILFKARLLGAKTVWWGHFKGASAKAWRLWLRSLLMRFSDALIFYTDFEVAEFHSSFKFKGALLVRGLNNGLDLADIKSVRDPYFATERENSLLFIGRLTEKSELKLLLRALHEPRLEKVHLRVIGTGNEDLNFRNYARSLGISDRVVWHGEMTSEAEIASIVNRCKLFVYPGAVGLSLLHAMSYGLPCIIHSERREHMPEFSAFDDYATGLAYQRGSSASLSAKISEALVSGETLEKWSQNCVAKTSESFNTEDMARRFCDLVDHLEGI